MTGSGGARPASSVGASSARRRLRRRLNGPPHVRPATHQPQAPWTARSPRPTVSQRGEHAHCPVGNVKPVDIGRRPYIVELPRELSSKSARATGDQVQRRGLLTLFVPAFIVAGFAERQQC